MFYYLCNLADVLIYLFSYSTCCLCSPQPWQRTIVAPSRVPFEDNTEPPDSLELEFVYGYTSDKSRQSLMHSPTGRRVGRVGEVGDQVGE